MAKNSGNGSQPNLPAELPLADRSDGGASPRLRGLDSNPQGAFGPRLWQAFGESIAHLYDTVALPDPSEEARFTLSTRTYATPRGILMHCQGTAFIMTRGPVMAARGPDQMLIVLQVEGSVDADYGGQRARRAAGDVGIVDYARPLHSASTDYASLMIVLARDAVPAALLALEPHGLIFPREAAAARLIGDALRSFYAHADDLTVSEAEAAIECIVALTAACARSRLAGDEAHRIKSKRKAALDYIDAHFANAQLGPGDVAAAANVSRASLYRLLAAEGGIRTVLLKRRLDEALRLMLADNKAERSLADIAKACGFGGAIQFNRAFNARFGSSPRRYCALVRQQDLDWHEARLVADGFDRDTFLWRQQGLGKSSAGGVRVAKQPGRPDRTKKPGKKS